MGAEGCPQADGLEVGRSPGVMTMGTMDNILLSLGLDLSGTQNRQGPPLMPLKLQTSHKYMSRKKIVLNHFLLLFYYGCSNFSLLRPSHHPHKQIFPYLPLIGVYFHGYFDVISPDSLLDGKGAGAGLATDPSQVPRQGVFRDRC